jgi:hypothetical protein
MDAFVPPSWSRVLVSHTDVPVTDRLVPRSRPPAALAVAVLAIVGLLGSAVMVVAHVSLGLPLVAIGFGLGIVAFGAVLLGVLRRSSWTWPVALAVNAIALAGSVMPWRGLERSGLPTLVAVIALAVLVSRPGRDALLYRDPR